MAIFNLFKKKKVLLILLSLITISTILCVSFKSAIKDYVIDVVTYNNQSKGLFEADNIQWCSFPIGADLDQGGVPYDIQDITHPSIVYIPNGFASQKIWAAATPYPQTLPTGGEPYENTCIYYADIEGDSFPLSFHQIKHNPIILKEGAEYNSDPDLMYDEVDSCLYVVTRKRHGADYKTRIVLQSSKDGFNWTQSLPIIETEGDLLCPCLVKCDSVYRIYAFENSTTGYRETKTIEVWESKSLSNPEFQHAKSVKWTNNSNVWHGDVVYYNNKYYLLYCGSNSTFSTLFRSPDPSKYLWVAESDNGYTFKEYNAPILKYNGVYRSTCVILNDVMHCYFSVSHRYRDDKEHYPYGNRIGYINFPINILQDGFKH